MHFLHLTLLAALTTLASADFLMSNTSICMGAFPFANCYGNTYHCPRPTGPVVITGTSNTTDFTCAKLMHAEDHSYITNGTAGPHGDGVVHSKNVCGNGKLKFVQYLNETNGGNATYYAEKEDGTHMADCQQVEAAESLSRHCNQWVGALFFTSMYNCTGTIDCS
ncbi:hypothetical protein LTR85_003543 [Meristemomyces frigidus]|nr:hypothetical protein LTR85_003543 [Meristemomyces frigidus]